MKVTVHIQPGCGEVSVTITAPKLTDEVKALAVRLQGGGVLTGWRGDVAILPFADDGATLVRRSLAHFAVTAGVLSLMVCLCGWNWGELVPLLVYLALLAAVYLLIWLTRWVRWYAEVAAIREKLGLTHGGGKKKEEGL